MVSENNTRHNDKAQVATLADHLFGTLSPRKMRRKYLEMGYTPIPLVARGKVPPKGFESRAYYAGERRVTPNVIDTWDHIHPDATNTGLLCGPRHGLLVIDADNESAVALMHGKGLPHTPRVRTGKGEHVYCACPDTITKSYTGDGALWAGIDLKASGYVVAPGSIHPNGTRYMALVPLSTLRAAPPQWVRNALSPGKGAHTPTTTGDSDVDALRAEIAAALGVERYNAAGYSNPVRCPNPRHADQHPSAQWHRDGFLKCHAGCRPGPGDVSAGKATFGWVDVARMLGLPLPVQRRLTSPAGLRLPSAITDGGVSDSENGESADNEIIGAVLTPLVLYLCTYRSKVPQLKKRGSDPDTWVIADINAQIADPRFADLPQSALSSAADYRKAVHSMGLDGVWTRAQQAKRLSVSESTVKRYDKAGNVIAEPRTEKRQLTDANYDDLPTGYDPSKGYLHIQALDGRPFVYTRAGLRRALMRSVEYAGRAVAHEVRRLPNHYTYPEHTTATPGLCVQAREHLIRNGDTGLARVFDALLLAGVKPGDSLTRADMARLVKPYGLSMDVVKRAMRGIDRYVEHDKGSPS